MNKPIPQLPERDLRFIVELQEMNIYHSHVLLLKNVLLVVFSSNGCSWTFSFTNGKRFTVCETMFTNEILPRIILNKRQTLFIKTQNFSQANANSFSWQHLRTGTHVMRVLYFFWDYIVLRSYTHASTCLILFHTVYCSEKSIILWLWVSLQSNCILWIQNE